MGAIQEVALAVYDVPGSRFDSLRESLSTSQVTELLNLQKLIAVNQVSQTKPLWPDWRQTLNQQTPQEASAHQSAEDDSWPDARSGNQAGNRSPSSNRKRKDAAHGASAAASKSLRSSQDTRAILVAEKATEKATLLKKLSKATAKKARRAAAAELLPALHSPTLKALGGLQGQHRPHNKARDFIRNQLLTRAGSSGRSAGSKLRTTSRWTLVESIYQQQIISQQHSTSEFRELIIVQSRRVYKAWSQQRHHRASAVSTDDSMAAPQPRRALPTTSGHRGGSCKKRDIPHGRQRAGHGAGSLPDRKETSQQHQLQLQEEPKSCNQCLATHHYAGDHFVQSII